ncbi:hypothetical protein D7X94_17480 [Acutalibacter sp. 1XD8-33]|uniref:hypothetical protein n=1 Tax=Acutalibacter sp. 1XD8-33 TaxID=2320081 RepID=UPI000EA11DDD|nr:hypothetical protein [Acutalibacter sp. 1XD8-33]RKJ38165.1 hypothetical protein D7X94_17480 [Acutalibacter sp. 1XD8-33]
MSNKEQCVALLDEFSEAQLVNVAAMLKTMRQTVAQAIEDEWDETPNATTIAAIEELESGGGERWTGSTADFFAMLDAEDEEEDDA